MFCKGANIVLCGENVTKVISTVAFYPADKLGLGHSKMKNSVVCGVCFMERATMQLRLKGNINKINFF